MNAATIDHRTYQDPQCTPTQPADGPLEFVLYQPEADEARAELTLQRWRREAEKRRLARRGGIQA